VLFKLLRLYLTTIQRLREWVVSPMKKALQRYPEWKENMPFDIVAKHQERSYSVSQVINGIIPNLQHGHDGLIFTCVESGYAPGTDEKILKWKPPSENSIDFRIELRFPALHPDSNEVDWTAKPVFILNMWGGGDQYEFFDEMEVDDDEWEQ
jgi:mRNA guanylyltransferase